MTERNRNKGWGISCVVIWLTTFNNHDSNKVIVGSMKGRNRRVTQEEEGVSLKIDRQIKLKQGLM